MQEVEDAAEDGEQQQTQYDHHDDHAAAFSYKQHTQRQTETEKPPTLVSI